MLSHLIKAGIGRVLQLPLVQRLAGTALMRSMETVRSHFFDSSQELGQAFQDSLKRAMIAIASGLASETELSGLWSKLKHVAVESKLSREFSSQIRGRYLEPFAHKHRYRLPDEALEQFRKESIGHCRRLAEENANILPLGSFAEPDWAALTNEAYSFEISGLLVERIATIGGCEERFLEFLQYDGLLGDAVLHFFHERMRRSSRVEQTLAALQREGMWTDLRDLQTSQQQTAQHLHAQLATMKHEIATSQEQVAAAMQAQNYELLGQWGQYLNYLKQAVQQQERNISDIPGFLRQLQNDWDAVGGRLERFSAEFGTWCGVVSDKLDMVVNSLDEIGATLGRVESGVLIIQDGVGQIHDDLDVLARQVASQSEALAALMRMMRNSRLESKIKARDEFSVRIDDSEDVNVIALAAQEVKRLPRTHRGFSMAAIQVSSALSSHGNIEKSIEFLHEALDNAQSLAERGLASYNLFQVYLRQKHYAEALQHYKTAVEIDTSKYALHDLETYPIQQILGAGGMGCVFLCKDRVMRKQVVVKSFWEPPKGSLEDVFSEVTTMATIASQYVPTPLGYGYADRQQKERPFIVMEHVTDAIDGEAYLDQHGPMSLVDGLQVGLQITKGLELAHNAGVSHLDLKPANLLLRRVDGEMQVKIIDFGLSQVATVTTPLQQGTIAKSSSGRSGFAQKIFGTLGYAPPEQLGYNHYGQSGPHSDLFSFGATLYRLMSGEHPSNINPRRMREQPELYELICECMEQDPKRRPESAKELVRRLEQLQEKQVGKTKIQVEEEGKRAEQRAKEAKIRDEEKNNIKNFNPEHEIEKQIKEHTPNELLTLIEDEGIKAKIQEIFAQPAARSEQKINTSIKNLLNQYNNEILNNIFTNLNSLKYVEELTDNEKRTLINLFEEHTSRDLQVFIKEIVDNKKLPEYEYLEQIISLNNLLNNSLINDQLIRFNLILGILKEYKINLSNMRDKLKIIQHLYNYNSLTKEQKECIDNNLVNATSFGTRLAVRDFKCTPGINVGIESDEYTTGFSGTVKDMEIMNAKLDELLEGITLSIITTEKETDDGKKIKIEKISRPIIDLDFNRFKKNIDKLIDEETTEKQKIEKQNKPIQDSVMRIEQNKSNIESSLLIMDSTKDFEKEVNIFKREINIFLNNLINKKGLEEFFIQGEFKKVLELTRNLYAFAFSKLRALEESEDNQQIIANSNEKKLYDTINTLYQNVKEKWQQVYLDERLNQQLQYFLQEQHSLAESLIQQKLGYSKNEFQRGLIMKEALKKLGKSEITIDDNIVSQNDIIRFIIDPNQTTQTFETNKEIPIEKDYYRRYLTSNGIRNEMRRLGIYDEYWGQDIQDGIVNNNKVWIEKLQNSTQELLVTTLLSFPGFELLNKIDLTCVAVGKTLQQREEEGDNGIVYLYNMLQDRCTEIIRDFDWPIENGKVNVDFVKQTLQKLSEDTNQNLQTKLGDMYFDGMEKLQKKPLGFWDRLASWFE